MGVRLSRPQSREIRPMTGKVAVCRFLVQKLPAHLLMQLLKHGKTLEGRLERCGRARISLCRTGAANAGKVRAFLLSRRFIAGLQQRSAGVAGIHTTQVIQHLHR